MSAAKPDSRGVGLGEMPSLSATTDGGNPGPSIGRVGDMLTAMCPTPTSLLSLICCPTVQQSLEKVQPL